MVVAAILVFIREVDSGNQASSDPTLLLALFGLLLSVLGFLVVIALSLAYGYYITEIVLILYRWNTMEFFSPPKKPFSFMNVQRYFFEITIAFFAVLLLFLASQTWGSLLPFHEHPMWCVGVFVIISVIAELLYRSRWRKYVKDNWRFMAALRNDSTGIYRDNWDTWFKDLNFRRNIIKDAKRKKW